jgi:hypothetical protein
MILRSEAECPRRAKREIAKGMGLDADTSSSKAWEGVDWRNQC